MIVLDLTCRAGHRFEGWFASVEAYEAQLAQHLVGCPHCNDTAIQRLPTGPHLRRSKGPPAGARPAATLEQALGDLLDRLNVDAEDVGRQFPQEARRIHHHEAPERTIRGQASIEEALELLDEGIAVLPVPPTPAKLKH